MDMIVRFLLWFDIVVLIYFVILNFTYLVTTLLSFDVLRRYAVRMKSIHVNDLLATGGTPPITLLVPAYNERDNCVGAIRSFLVLDYPHYDVIVINDGSTDDTLDVLTDAFDLLPAVRVPTATLETESIRGTYRSRRHPNLWVIDKENGGKSDALNAGLNICSTPLFCALDADTLLEREALIRVVRPFLESQDTIAAGGIIRIANGCEIEDGQVVRVGLPKKLLPRLQVLEYLRAFLAGRVAWERMGASLIISGAFGIFHRGLVVDIDGYSRDTVGEDMDLVVRLHRHCRQMDRPYKVAFVPDPVAWTECPEKLSVLGHQRDRWQRGLIQSLWGQRGMMLNPRYGQVGMVGFPYFLLLEMLGPTVEILGYACFVLSIFLGIVDPVFLVAFLMVAVVFGIVLSVGAVALEELTFRRYPNTGDLVRLFGLAVVENFGFRQLTTWWRFRGTLSAVLGRRSWGRMDRHGVTSRGVSPTPATASGAPLERAPLEEVAP